MTVIEMMKAIERTPCPAIIRQSEMVEPFGIQRHGQSTAARKSDRQIKPGPLQSVRSESVSDRSLVSLCGGEVSYSPSQIAK
jgi:hypothetical protein